MVKARYLITLLGCDDQTEFFMDLTDEEVRLITRVSQLSLKVSAYRCQPRLIFRLITEKRVKNEEHNDSSELNKPELPAIDQPATAPVSYDYLQQVQKAAQANQLGAAFGHFVPPWSTQKKE
jgi:hypothetical protein